MTLEKHLFAFFTSAETIIDDGLAYARVDDPHRFATVGEQFDDGKARRQLVVDYMTDGRARVSLLLVGAKAGEEVAIEMFATTVQGPSVGRAR
ncbi:MAG: hypothetical protein IBJ14_11735 [Hydrogenophaga sp.]|nr:hypothetical protein [Hydrogenophaga sp.]